MAVRLPPRAAARAGWLKSKKLAWTWGPADNARIKVGNVRRKAREKVKKWKSEKV
jgi:ribosome recycling factor